MKLHSRNWLSISSLLPIFASAIHLHVNADIVIAQVAPMTNPIVAEGKEINLGIRIAIDAANARQDIPGQKIILRTEDDQLDPEKTVALIRKLAKSDTLALLNVIGSPTMAKILQERVLEAEKIPLIGVIPGSEALRKPMNPYVFHVRASDSEQYRRLIRNALTIGLNRIAVVYLDTPPVKAGVQTVDHLLKEASLTTVAQIAIPINGDKLHAEAIKSLKTANPNLILLALPGQIAGEVVNAYRSQGMHAQITSLSYGNAEAICQGASAEAARGVSIAQILPSIRNTAIPLVRQFNEDFQRFSAQNSKPNNMQFEGYVSARVLIEGIKRINGAPSREKLIRALNSMQNINLGGFPIDYSPSKHHGSEYVEIGVLTNGCTMLY